MSDEMVRVVTHPVAGVHRAVTSNECSHWRWTTLSAVSICSNLKRSILTICRVFHVRQVTDARSEEKVAARMTN